MKLVDADRFLQWIENRGIKLILHGHKHIPKIHTHNDITIIAAGSSTGKVRHVEEGKTFLTYNLIKYDIESKRPISCSIIAEEILGSGTKICYFIYCKTVINLEEHNQGRPKGVSL